MGDSRPDNGGGWPPEDGSGPLPELPPEWGTIVIPDDAAELDAEADALRRELRREARKQGGQARFGLRPESPSAVWWLPRRHQGSRRSDEPAMGVPIVIMAVAVLTTLVSLFVVTWGRQGAAPVPVATHNVSGETASTTSTNIAEIELHDAGGGLVRLGTLTPAVVLLVDACDCADVVNGVAAKAPPGVRVLAVAGTARTIPKAPDNVISLADPDDTLRSRFPAVTGPAGVTALVIDRSGRVVFRLDGMTRASDLPVARMS